MLMHEDAYSGRGNTIHSDDYATPLEWRSGLLYMSILGKPTDQD